MILVAKYVVLVYFQNEIKQISFLKNQAALRTIKTDFDVLYFNNKNEKKTPKSGWLNVICFKETLWVLTGHIKNLIIT